LLVPDRSGAKVQAIAIKLGYVPVGPNVSARGTTAPISTGTMFPAGSRFTIAVACLG